MQALYSSAGPAPAHFYFLENDEFRSQNWTEPQN
jgi:hypothetical protein